MKDYKVLFGYAAILLSIGFVIRSITFAYAYPTGPNVSMGSNPIENIYGYDQIAAGNTNTLFTNNTQGPFIITQYLSNTTLYCTLQIDGNSILEHHKNFGQDYVYGANNFTGTIVVSAGSTLSIKNNAGDYRQCAYYMDGYYAHP